MIASIVGLDCLSSRPMLWSCSDIAVTFRQDDGSQTIALHDVTLSIQKGEKVAIVGPNGSGKSTLALLIAGLIEPTSGAITGDALHSGRPTGAMVFQSPDDNLLGETVREELEMCLERIVAGPALSTAVNSSLSRLGVQSLADHQTTTLSGGEKQVIALTCAMASGRPIIVLDEPTSHLDPLGKRLLWESLDVATNDTEYSPAIIVVTQYAEEIHHFDRLIALDKGTIVHDGAPAAWHRPKSAVPVNISFTSNQGSPPILSVKGLGQSALPGWPLPHHPIHDVSLEIHPGEAIALCGPIGAGKTTLALILAGLLPKHTGQRTAVEESPVMLIQFPERQIFCTTVEAEVAYGLIARGWSGDKATARTRDALGDVGLSAGDVAKRDPHSVSGGQKRRVMLAAASVLDAPLYILDEPQAALDDEGLRVIQFQCQSWLTRGASYLLISHDLNFLRALTSRVLVLNQGKLLFDGTWEALDASPKLLSDIGFE